MAKNAANFENRPWGIFEVLNEFKLVDIEVVIKKITVKPKQRLSYQAHQKRNELWFVIAGEALVMENNEQIVLHKDESVFIKIGDKHRIENPGESDLVFLETSTPEFDENNIIRYEDDYKRV